MTICQLFKGLYLYVFGSFIKSVNYHDIDIAICLEKDFNKNDYKKYPYGYESKLNTELEQLLRRRVDIVIMNNAGLTLLKKIVNMGKVIIGEQEQQRITYENYIRKLYIDAENIRSIKRRYLKRKLSNA